MKKYCYFNGKIKLGKDVRISPEDLGMLRGYAVFDVMRTANGKPFLLKEHYARLKKSAGHLKLKVSFSVSDFERIVARLMKLNKAKEATVRTVITGGISRDAFAPEGKPTYYILLETLHEFSPEAYLEGARLFVLENNLRIPEAKATINYLEAIKCQDEKCRTKSHEIIYIKDGKVLECSTSNIFIVKNKTVITPKEKMLLGVTRNLVIKLIRKKFKLEEREVSEQEMCEADEIFFTATNKGVVPVIKIGNKKIAGGKIGPIAREIGRMYDDFVENY